MRDEFFSTTAYDNVQAGLAIFKDDSLISTPGDAYFYSTYGYNLISAVVEAAAGQEFLDYMVENVFGPTGMTQTTADKVVPLISNRSRYYRLEGGQHVNTRWVDNSNKWAGGGFLSTSEDLARFVQAHLTEDHLSAASIDEMWTPQTPNAGNPVEYGIGWAIQDDGAGRPIIRHGGGSVGGITEMRLYRSEELIVTMITNLSSARLGPLADDIASVFLPNPQPPAVAAISPRLSQ